MGLFEIFPYTNFHDLNLDWILNEIRTMEKTFNDFVSINALKYADPIQWNIVQQYEKNTIVIDPLTGTAYISVQPVPSGISLTNPDYWTVVFDLGSFVVRAAKNFTDKFEEDSTLTATFPSDVNDWIIWGDVLYRVVSPIVAGDQYVIGSNIIHFTAEDVIGHIQELNTTDKSNVVAAINELVQAIIDEASRVDDITGDLNDLDTTDKSNLVAAINEVLQTIIDTCGALADLDTADQSNLVAAINEVLQTIIDTCGALADLTTTDKSNLVAAINEVKNEADENADKIASIKNAVKDKIVFIGDSYARDVTRDGVLVYGWITRLIDDLGFSGSYRLVSDEAGKTATGFSTESVIGVSFETMLTDLVSTLTDDEKAAIGSVVVCGGGNDDVTSASILNPFIQSFCDYVKNNLPNAQVYIGFIYGDARTSTNYNYVNNGRFSYHASPQYGALYLNGVDNMLHNYAQAFASDEHHPNNAGSLAIARGIKSALLEGYAGQFLPKRNVIGTPDSAFTDTSTYTAMMQYQVDDIMYTELQSFGRNLSTPISVVTGTPIDIATVPDTLIRKDTLLGLTPVRFYDGVNEEYIMCNVDINTAGILQIIPRGNMSGVVRINLFTTLFTECAYYC